MNGPNALVLMCKAPIPGNVKTRLCPPLSHGEAAGFHACLLEDTAEEAGSVRGIRRFLFRFPAKANDYFLAPVFSGYLLREQAGKDLGERLVNAMNEALSGGARSVVAIGSDCPALSAERIRCAFRELAERSEAVFGPAYDGGFYLIGLSSPFPEILKGIEWSTGTVLSEILSRCRKSKMPYSLLPAESDVDCAEDLERLMKRMRLRMRPEYGRTRRWLRARGIRFSGRAFS